MALITVSQIKKEPYLTDLNQTVEFDDDLSKMIDSASLQIEQYLGVKFSQVTSQVEYFGNGFEETTHLYLNHVGNIANEQIVVDTGKVFDITKTAPLTVNTDYDIFSDQGLIVLAKAVVKGRKIIKITYDAGYAQASIPEDVQRAALLQVTTKWLRRGELGTSSTTTPDGSVITIDRGLIEDVRELLEPYRRHFF